MNAMYDYYFSILEWPADISEDTKQKLKKDYHFKKRAVEEFRMIEEHAYDCRMISDYEKERLHGEYVSDCDITLFGNRSKFINVFFLDSPFDSIQLEIGGQTIGVMEEFYIWTNDKRGNYPLFYKCQKCGTIFCDENEASSHEKMEMSTLNTIDDDKEAFEITTFDDASNTFKAERDTISFLGVDCGGYDCQRIYLTPMEANKLGHWLIDKAWKMM